MKKILWLLLIILLVVVVTPLHAQEPTVGSKEDNACNEGGSMAGKCDTPWEWVCGYYLARWEEAGGWSGGYNLPTWCESVLPARPVDPITGAVVVVGPGCVSVPGWWSVDFKGGFTIPAPVFSYPPMDCTAAPNGQFLNPMVYAVNQPAAAALCQSTFLRPNTTATQHPNIFQCIP